LSIWTIVGVAALIVIIVVGALMYQTVTNIRTSVSVVKLVMSPNGPVIAFLNFSVHNGGLLPFSASYTLTLRYGTQEITKNFTVSVGGGGTQSFIFGIPLNSSLITVSLSGSGIYDYRHSEDLTSLVLDLQRLYVYSTISVKPPTYKGGYIQERELSEPVNYSFSIILLNVTDYLNGSKLYFVKIEFFPLSKGGISINSTAKIYLSTNVSKPIELTLFPYGKAEATIVTQYPFFNMNFSVLEGNARVGYGFYNVSV